jgi:hypothetical protein
VAEIQARTHNIEMVSQAPAQAVTPRRGNVLDPTNDRAKLNQAARDGYDDSREPVVLRVVLVNQIADARDEWVSYQDLRPSARFEKDLPKRLWVDESMAKDDDWLISADWCWQTGDLLWKVFDKANVQAIGASRIAINMPAFPERTLSTDRRLMVRINYRYRSGVAPGLQFPNTNTIWLATTDMGAQANGGPTAATAIAQAELDMVAIHEVGHFLGMVPQEAPAFYVEKGHKGPHCCTGLSADERDEARYVGLPGSCVMFGGPSAAQQPQFCAECDTSLKTRKINNKRMPRDW